MKVAVGLRTLLARAQTHRQGMPVVVALLATALLSPLAAQAQAPGTGTAAKPANPSTGQPAAKPAPGTAPGAAAPGSAAPKAAPNMKQQGSYSIGVLMGEQLKRLGLSADAIATDRVTAGLHDALTGKAKVSEADQQNIEALVASAAEANHAAAKNFLAENAKKKDVVTTASGLQYRVVTPGAGTSPKPSDEVTVNYRGTLLDGTEFDSSYKRGQPATFQVGNVIPGWQEALQLMKPGAKYQLFIPPNLAYDMNSPPGIPPGSLLIFDVEMLSAKPQAAAQGKPGTMPQGSPGTAAPPPTSPPPK
jgi:FKBP-type peptidyl-prolyl cis-trans isomerase